MNARLESYNGEGNQVNEMEPCIFFIDNIYSTFTTLTYNAYNI